MRRDEVLVHYTRGNTLISMRKEGASYFYHYDGLGSVRQLTDSEGEVEEEYLYDAFGNLIEDNDHDNPYGFTGEQQFNEPDGLIFLRARYYDPSVGRFVSRDPILSPMVGDYGSLWLVPYLVSLPNYLHPYVYVANNPVNWVDPTGELRIPAIKPPWKKAARKILERGTSFGLCFTFLNGILMVRGYFEKCPEGVGFDPIPAEDYYVAMKCCEVVVYHLIPGFTQLCLNVIGGR